MILFVDMYFWFCFNGDQSIKEKWFGNWVRFSPSLCLLLLFSSLLLSRGSFQIPVQHEQVKEVRSIKKKGICWNEACSMSKGKIDRRALMCCARCRGVYYCSAECQKTSWPHHKIECDEWVAKRAEFDANTRQMG